MSCPDGLVAEANPPLLEQAVINLVDNAIKYSDRGGTVRLTAARDNGELVMQVVDDGVGIEPEHLPRLFERFYRVDKARSRKLGGTGLGLSIDNQCDSQRDYVVITGGGPGIMEAANRGAFDVGCKSIGLNIKLPAEQQPNPFITPELCFQFKYFALRKFHFILRAAAVVLFPGGFGTLDEMFETLTLRQTHRMQPVPIILFGRDYWSRVIDFQFLADSGVIADRHLDLFTYAETPEEAWQQILDFHAHEHRGE